MWWDSCAPGDAPLHIRPRDFGIDAVQKFTTAVDSLSDLTAVPQPFAVPIDTSIQSYFETSGDSVARALEYKMTLYDGGECAMDVSCMGGLRICQSQGHCHCHCL